ncbi:MAG: Na(+)-translocating NADH-quinone reductase subunit C [Bacteriovoracaceae bacterium]|jgi:Na+-transporting NADH:ubiquinone oxidoreductase subunit C|nr:Na(+)-translocating NADH-quinone reductase subunit C [Bacteriovoracaceae bacterium]
MSASKDTTGKTLIVAFALCVVCSVLVSSLSVGLKPRQLRNKELDMKKNILMAAGEYNDQMSIGEQFKKFSTFVVDLEKGEINSSIKTDGFDENRLMKDSSTRHDIDSKKDLGKIKKRAKYSLIYAIKENGQIKKLILPVRGKGLWSTLYGFLALDSDYNTVKGLGFYSHGETPGLGGEVDNPSWKKKWIGKKAFSSSGQAALEVVKGLARSSNSNFDHQVDGLSGATLTSNGVTGLLRYWLGEDGFGPFLVKLKTGNIQL